MDLPVRKDFKTFNGEIAVPSDKSISHRAVIFSSLAKGKSIIRNFSMAADPLSSVEVCKNLGADIEIQENNLIVNSCGKFNYCSTSLNCGNSGTTMRFMAGALAGQDYGSVLIGDDSLSKRPMKRIIEPLKLMGAKIDSEDFHAPLKIYSAKLHGINYNSKIASAQVKSCVLLAGLNASGVTVFKEPYLSRNHTEIMLKSMGADISANGFEVVVKKSDLMPLDIEICGDISSAAYFIAAGMLVQKSEIILKNVGLNPTRTGIIDVIRSMGGDIEILNRKEVCGEIVGDIKVKYSPDLRGCEISGNLIPRLIDEIPLIALIATQAEGLTVIKDAQDLRNKESDRISATVEELRKLGAEIKETSDGMIIYGKSLLQGDVKVCSHGDHRLAMMLYIAGLLCEKEICIKDFEWVKISFPNYLNLFEKLKS